MAEQEKKVDWNKADPEIVYSGKMITLPGDPGKMPLKTAIETLTRKMADEETIMVVVEFIDTHPMDGAVAFAKAMKKKYGWASAAPTPGFFGPKPPQMRSVRVGPNNDDVVTVPWGRFVLPGVEGNVNTGVVLKDGRPQFVIHGELKKKDHAIIKELAQLTREILAEESIYKSKAIRLRVTEEGKLNHDIDPDFLATAQIKDDDLVLNPGEGEQVKTALWTPIFHTKACLTHKIPLKRGVLLEGPYGCGKSMICTITSKYAVENGWTFIALDDVRALGEALLFARRYAPAVVFAEDIDRAAEKRDQKGNDLLNVIDGILSKDAQVITVLTTNFVEKLDKAMLRPGRLDAVISIKAPDANSVQKLVRVYARDLLHEGSDLSEVGRELAGQIPATVREVVERSKLTMVQREGKVITAHDLLIAARGMKHHLALLAPKTDSETVADRLYGAMRETVGREHPKLDRSLKLVEEIHEHVVEN